MKEDTVEIFQLPDLRFMLNEAFWFGEGQFMLRRQRISLCFPDKWEWSSLCREEVVLSDGVCGDSAAVVAG